MYNFPLSERLKSASATTTRGAYVRSRQRFCHKEPPQPWADRQIPVTPNKRTRLRLAMHSQTAHTGSSTSRQCKHPSLLSSFLRSTCRATCLNTQDRTRQQLTTTPPPNEHIFILGEPRDDNRRTSAAPAEPQTTSNRKQAHSSTSSTNASHLSLSH